MKNDGEGLRHFLLFVFNCLNVVDQLLMADLSVCSKGDYTVFIENEGSWIAACSSEQSEIHISRACKGNVVCKEHLGVGEVGLNVRRRILLFADRVNCKHYDLTIVVGCHLIKVGQLLLTGTAPCAPEVDDHDLALKVGYVDRSASVNQLKTVGRTLVTDLVSYGDAVIRVILARIGNGDSTVVVNKVEIYNRSYKNERKNERGYF